MRASDRVLHRGKRWLYLIHRWVGIVTCLFVLIWFLSGLVMMYVPFPALTAAERVERLAPIDWGQVRVGPGEALEIVRQETFPARIALESIGTAPVWRISTADGVEHDVSATTGQAIAAPIPGVAAAIAQRFARTDAPATVTTIERDQWTVAGGFNRFRPLYQVDLADDAGTRLYLASATGAVVLDTTRTERFWNWLGAVPHWIYPTVLRQDQPLWRQVVLWSAGLCIVGAVSGMWIGILRIRLRRRFKQDRASPYRGWQYWHHIIGLIGGTLLTTWIVSGWLSVDPGRWFASPGLSDAMRATYAGAGPMPPLDLAAIRARPELGQAKRMRVTWVDGRPLLVFEMADRDPLVLDARTMTRAGLTNEIAAALRRAMPGAVPAVTTLTAPDAYWYEAKGSVELPILRVTYDDPAGTWLHISPRTGEIVGEADRRRRVYRWMYDGMHRWDFQGLITRRPLWDIWMWLWSIAGIVVSLSGIVIGFRRLARRAA